MENYETNSIESLVVSVDDFFGEEKHLVIHSHINQKGKMILNKGEAALLLLEIYKFITNKS
jgi:hypothetical protein